MSEVLVGALDELKQVTVVSDGVPEPIAVFKLPSGVYAISDTCTHEETPLSDGDVDEEDETIECMLHGAVFSLPTGMSARFRRRSRSRPTKRSSVTATST